MNDDTETIVDVKKLWDDIVKLASKRKPKYEVRVA